MSRWFERVKHPGKTGATLSIVSELKVRVYGQYFGADLQGHL